MSDEAFDRLTKCAEDMLLGKQVRVRNGEFEGRVGIVEHIEHRMFNVYLLVRSDSIGKPEHTDLIQVHLDNVDSVNPRNIPEVKPDGFPPHLEVAVMHAYRLGLGPWAEVNGAPLKYMSLLEHQSVTEKLYAEINALKLECTKPPQKVPAGDHSKDRFKCVGCDADLPWFFEEPENRGFCRCCSHIVK